MDSEKENKKIKIINCPECDGSGYIAENILCTECQGKGKLEGIIIKNG